MVKQTAVEWLIDKLSNIKAEDFNSTLEVRLICQQAKAMEKEDKIKFAKHCLDKALDLDIRTAFFNVEQYYNENYGK